MRYTLYRDGISGKYQVCDTVEKNIIAEGLDVYDAMQQADKFNNRGGTMTQQQREEARNYARAIGHSNAETMSDEQLTGIMNYMADECAKYGSD